MSSTHLDSINRIAYLSIARLPSRTANSIHVMRMCQALAKQGVSTTLYAPAFSDAEIEDISTSIFNFYGVSECFRVKLLPWFAVKGQSTIYSALVALHVKFSGADIVYARDLKSALFCSKLGLSIIYEAHSPIDKKNRLFSHLIESKRLIRLVVISDALRKIFAKDYPAVRDRMLIAHDAADSEETGRDDPYQPGKRLRAAYVGHLYKGRGIDLILALAERCPWADFEIVGGMDSDIKYWRTLSENSANIHFHGHLPYKQAAEIRRNCDILLAPFSRKLEVSGGGADTSGWMSPMKIFEYMAAGKAIVCTDLPVLREVLENEKTALLCETENVEQWQQAMERLKNDPALRIRIGKQARERMEKHHTWSSRASAVLGGFS